MPRSTYSNMACKKIISYFQVSIPCTQLRSCTQWSNVEPKREPCASHESHETSKANTSSSKAAALHITRDTQSEHACEGASSCRHLWHRLGKRHPRPRADRRHEKAHFSLGHLRTQSRSSQKYHRHDWVELKETTCNDVARQPPVV